MYTWCSFCKFFTNQQEKTFITDWGDEVSLERGVCCQDNSIVSPQEFCHIDWKEKAWIERMGSENEGLNNSR